MTSSHVPSSNWMDAMIIDSIVTNTRRVLVSAADWQVITAAKRRIAAQLAKLTLANFWPLPDTFRL